ncbi:hypothetical protein [Billgrantia endophytica]|uniref:hypothetical protein n=1 Tax=Billgrantia endophytica TaxID=2033802 RepID=UPI00197A7B56|nr:hypothetical protein [Halomonas endophytica]
MPDRLANRFDRRAPQAAAVSCVAGPGGEAVSERFGGEYWYWFSAGVPVAGS